MPKSALPKIALPNIAGYRSQFAFICLAAMLGLAAPAAAAIDARLGPDDAGDAAPLVYTVPDGAVSLAGFHCGLIRAEEAAAFADDPDYSETPPTIGLEFVLDAGGVPPLTSTVRSGFEESPVAEMKTPLSARLKRILVEGNGPSLNDSAAMEDVFLPEASMSVADLIGRCHP